MANNVPSGDRLADRLTNLHSAAQSIERLSADYHAALRPVRQALQAVADVPLDERDRWASSVSALARQLSESGMADVPASLEGVERWDRQFDAGDLGRAFAGRAFCSTLAAAIRDGSPPASFFVTLDRHPFITPHDGVREVCAVLSQLLYVHTERTAPRFTRAYGKIVAEVGMDGEMLRYRLAQCGIFLSADAAAAVHDWDECSTGVPFYPADIRPAAACTRATSGPERNGELAQLPAAVRRWLTARYLADPTPGMLRRTDGAEPEPIVFVRYEEFAEYLVNAGFDLLPNLDDWKNAGWIDDVYADLTPTDSPTNPLPYYLARLNLPLGRHRLVGIWRTVLDAPAESDLKISEKPEGLDEPPTGKVPGVVSLNVLRAHLEMVGSPDWREQVESWPEVPFLRLRCATLFPGQPFSAVTIELLMAWFQDRGLTADQARHLPLAEAARRLQLNAWPPAAQPRRALGRVSRSSEVYHLLVAYSPGDWDKSVYELPRGRFLEKDYTEPQIIEKFRRLDTATVEVLKSLPALFTYEGERHGVRVGYIRKIRERSSSLVINYEFDQSIPEFPFSAIAGSQLQLDIHGSEMNHTHWTVKDADLFAVLRTVGVMGDAAVTPAGKPQRIEDMTFKVALSFPGEKRNYVRKVANHLVEKLPPGSVFYDNFFQAQLAKPGLDTLLQRIYSRQSDLTVVFLCADYEKKDWCGIEWRAIREIIKKRQFHSIMFLRFDYGPVEGILSTDGYINIDKLSTAKTAQHILERVWLNDADKRRV